jgi:dTMP kinase
MSARGRFITLEGVDGAGKSSHVQYIADTIGSGGRRVVVTREPGGTAGGERIRQLLLDPAARLVPETELLLMFAARAQLVRETVGPALARGAAVLSDRFTDASFAYQGGGRGIDPGIIAELERWAAGIKPDLTFLLDVGVEVGLARARSRGLALDRIESEQLDFFDRVRATYLARAAAEPGRFRVIDAAQSPAQVLAAVTSALSAWLGQARAGRPG